MYLNLDKSDLIRFESILKNSLASLISFTSYSLYFPREIPLAMQEGKKLVPIIEKDRTLLPLSLNNNFLGIFLAKGTDYNQLISLKDHLGSFTSLSLDKLFLHKQCMLDELTGLSNREQFTRMVEREIESVLSSITPGPAATMDNGPERHSASFWIMIFNLDRFRRINNTYGYMFGDQVLEGLAAELKRVIPEQAALARLWGDTFGLFQPQSSPSKCQELAKSILEKISETVFEYAVSGEKVSLTASAGSSFFPQDIKGHQFRKTPYELARIAIQKAQQALDIAKENGRGRSYFFGQLLSRGGVIMENLPLNRMIINLGKNVDACEGQKFMVWSRKFNGHSQIIQEPDKKSLGHYPPIHKGEITLQEVQERISIAEVLYLNDPSWEIEPGDKLSLLPEKDSLLENNGIVENTLPKKDIMTGLYSYRDFVSLWSKNRNCVDSFSMVMIRIHDHGKNDSEQGIGGENLILELMSSLKAVLAEEPLGGRYSSTCLIFYFPGQSPQDLYPALCQLSSSIRDSCQASIFTGIACFPYLNYSRINTLENCRKSLEHADLIEFPHVACFDSLTLTVSADRLFTRGDTFAALEEYKLALAADEANTLARNSLAICYARLGRMEMAAKQFQEIIGLEDQNIMAWYNLGCAHLKQGDLPDAEKAFEKCLEIERDHAFSLFRLGQLAENSGDLDKADKYYNQARETSSGKNLAPRHLARLAWKKGDREQAREHLHQALINNPRDAFSLNLMARIYLENNDDPQIAESLARQSVVLRPDVAGFWNDLAETLKAQGKEDQAAQAKARAFA
ncbi:diguanylate cyclase domain-containing protein [Desulfonatronovibrio hydrogenovorans]|uniref:diguanylate cyclase domain-containing protein n=1 Tax=Desulfonatronovibrio hydrogenovorans TaxID=53245 RepID=UPI00048C9A35|nr:diguanylate cyclase [Desulfonatronovibrio hydrogenovorans]